PGEDAVFCPQDCGGGSGGAGGAMPACDHDACDTGGPLDPACDACAATVCGSDPFCCTNQWDTQCVGEASSQCGSACCGNGTCNQGEDCRGCPADCGQCPKPASCPHSVCLAGAALDPAECPDSCYGPVCMQKPSCCGNASWGMSCQVLAAQLCGADP